MFEPPGSISEGHPMQEQRLDANSPDARPKMTERIEAQIQRRLGGQVKDLRVEIRDGGLILRGRTRTRHAKQLALQTVLDMTELPIRSNEIRVETDPRSVDPLPVVSSTRTPRDEPLPEERGGDIGEPRGEARASLFARMAAIWSRNQAPSFLREGDPWDA
jgi:hypothetical protein